jgi:hypothetical protein
MSISVSRHGQGQEQWWAEPEAGEPQAVRDGQCDRLEPSGCDVPCVRVWHVEPVRCVCVMIVCLSKTAFRVCACWHCLVAWFRHTAHGHRISCFSPMRVDMSASDCMPSVTRARCGHVCKHKERVCPLSRAACIDHSHTSTRDWHVVNDDVLRWLIRMASHIKRLYTLKAHRCCGG